MISLFQLPLKRPSIRKMLTNSMQNLLSKLQMVQLPYRQNRFYLKEVINFYLMFCAMLEESLSAISNGLKIWITSDQDVCKENGKRRVNKICSQLFVRQQDWLKINLTEVFSYKEQLRETLFMLVCNKLCLLQQAKLLRLQ